MIKKILNQATNNKLLFSHTKNFCVNKSYFENKRLKQV